MKKVLDIVTLVLSEAFQTCGYEERFAQAFVSNRPDLCEYQCNGAMAAAKAYKKAPLAIAQEIVEKLTENALFKEAVAAAPGFINLRISEEILSSYLNQMSEDEKLGLNMPEKPLTILADYGGANVAKPLHVGHLRSAIIGESIKRIARFWGNHVLSDVHLGDWGLPIGLIIEMFRSDCGGDIRKYLLDRDLTIESVLTISELERIYPLASERSKTDKEFLKMAQETTVLLQNGYEEYLALWQHIMKVSKEDLKKNYDRLSTSFDLWKGESDAQPYMDPMIDDLVKRGIAYESQGAIVVDVKEETDKKEIPPCLIRKSDGAALYTTSDLGTLVEREKLYQPDRYIYMTDKRQELHFLQVFRVAKKAGIVREGVDMHFLGFGTMNGKDGKPFKTRSGGVMRLEYLIEEINEAVYQKMVENHKKSADKVVMTEEEMKHAAKIIGLSAIKYGDLSNQSAKDYIFDVDRFTEFEGNTGPYILYTIVRIKSILARYKENHTLSKQDTIRPALSSFEKDLQLQLTKCSDALEASYQELAPHKICQYIYDLSDIFNRFYHEVKILTEPDPIKQSGWIALIQLTQKVLELGIDLLGFEAPDRM